ncbi:hypothetical protein LQD23_08285 [Chromobacterium violaceum]|uniref:hypothetical protein n=1 Tax=Chromobacterium violaceum TaxID=536 RepID=UPI001E38A1C0|nr:hypothetical protein [Chromobacterium violaceum]MCD0492293.1 hypothetical protein [Chromobacterium violaceum]
MQTLTQLADAAFENAWQELGIHQHIIAHCKEPSEIAQWGWRAALAWQQMQSPATEQSGEAVAEVISLPSARANGPKLTWSLGAVVHVGMKLYARPQSAPAEPVCHIAEVSDEEVAIACTPAQRLLLREGMQLYAAPQAAQQRKITDDELLEAFWPHVEVQLTGTIRGLVEGLRAVEKLVVPQPKEGGEA